MNRLLGTLFALATLAAIAYAILNVGNYTSICFTSAPDAVEVADEESVIEPDSLQMVYPEVEVNPVDVDSEPEVVVTPVEQ